MKRVIVYPDMNLPYASYYMAGLYQLFGKDNVRFASVKELQLFPVKSGLLLFLVYTAENDFKKICIDYNDSNELKNQVVYDWSDIYGKVNTNFDKTPLDRFRKIKVLGPNFGIRILSFPESFTLSIKNYFILHPANSKKFFLSFFKQNRKLYISEYPLSQAKKNYVFSLNTLWHSDEWNKLNETTNKVRADFMETCLELEDIRFEGGFVPSMLGNNEFKHLQVQKSVSQSEYIEKLRKSVVVFNTPAVWNCHGWKLGEYLCMGKAIISTPLSNELPSKLVHGEHIHFVNNKDEMKEAVLKINSDINYRTKLENNARKYYENFVSPESSIKLLGIL